MSTARNALASVSNVFMAAVLVITMMPGGGLRAYADEAQRNSAAAAQVDTSGAAAEKQVPASESAAVSAKDGSAAAVEKASSSNESVAPSAESVAADESASNASAPLDSASSDAAAVEGEGTTGKAADEGTASANAAAAADSEKGSPANDGTSNASNSTGADSDATVLAASEDNATAGETQSASALIGNEGASGNSAEKQAASDTSESGVAASKDAASKDAAAKEDKEDTKMTAAAEQTTLVIDLKDTDGNALSRSEIGSGATVYYYKMTSTQYDELMRLNPRNDPQAYIAAWRQYERTVTLTSPSYEYSIGEDLGQATADNPYILMFLGGGRIEEAPQAAGSFPYYSGYVQTGASKWLANFEITYDGTSVAASYGATTASDGKVHGTVYLDNTQVQASTTLTFDASTYMQDLEQGDPSAYPVYARVAFADTAPIPELSSDGTLTFSAAPHNQAVVKQVSADGTVQFQLPEAVSRLVSGTGPNPWNLLAVSFYSDEACTQPVYDWAQKTDYNGGSSPWGQFTFAVQVQPDGSIKSVNTQTMEASDFAPGFMRMSEWVHFEPITLKVDSNDPDAYPKYVKVALKATTDDGDVVVSSSVVQITANGEQQVELPKAKYEEGYYGFFLTADVYADEACATPDDVWNASYNQQVDVKPNGKLVDANDISVDIDTISLEHYATKFVPLTLSVNTNKPDVDYPVYAKVFLSGYDGDWHEDISHVVVRITENGDQQITLPKTDITGFEDLYLNATVFKDEDCTEQDEDRWWGAYFYSPVTVDEQGKFYEYGSAARQIDTVTLEHLYTQINPLSVETYSSDPTVDYPVYAKLNLTWYDWTDDDRPVVIAEDVLKFTDNGTKNFEMPAVDANKMYHMDLSYDLYSDEECTQRLQNWKGAGAKTVHVDETGQLVEGNYDGDEPPAVYGVKFSHMFEKSLSVPVTADFGTRASADFFPTTLEVTVSGDSSLGFEPVTVTKTYTSAEEIALDKLAKIEFAAAGDDVFPVTDSGYTISWSFYKDAAKTTPDDRWSSGSRDCGLSAEASLVHGVNSVGLNFRPLSVTVTPQALDEELKHDDAYPLYVSVLAMSAETGQQLVWTGERTNVDSFETEFPRMSFAFTDTGAGEGWLVSAGVEESDYATGADGWVPDPDPRAGQSFLATYQSLEGKLQYNKPDPYLYLNAWGYYDYKVDYVWANVVLKPTYTPTGVAAKLNVHVNVPEGVADPYLWHVAVGPEERLYSGSDLLQRTDAVHIRLFKMGLDGYEMVWEDDAAESYGYSHHFLDVRDLDATNKAEFGMGTLEPGTYYITWYMGRNTQSTDVDPAWEKQDELVKIVVQEDGTIVGEDGNTYTVEVNYKNDYTKTLVQPTIPIVSTFPEEHNGEPYCGSSYYINGQRFGYTDVYNPGSFHFSMTPLWSDAEEEFSVSRDVSIFLTDQSLGSNGPYLRFPIIEEGTTYMGAYPEFVRNMWWWGDNYYAGHNYSRYRPSEHNKTVTSLYSSNLEWSYPSSEHVGTFFDWYMPWHNASYYLYELFVGYPVGDYEVSYYVNDYEKYWYKETVQVHLAEDGKLYRIDNGEEFNVQLRMVDEAPEDVSADKTFDELTISVDTTVHGGVDQEKAFGDGKTYWVGFYCNDELIASGQTEITEVGTKALELTGPNGKPVPIYSDRYYELAAGTISGFDEDGNPVFDNMWRRVDYGFSDYRGNHILDCLGDNGVFCSYFTSESGEGYEQGEPMELPNEYLKLKWDPVEPKSVAQSSDEKATVFKPMTDLTQLQDKYNYIVVVENQFNGKWYALAYDENGGYQIELSDVTSLQDLKDGYKLLESEADGSMILTANSVKQAEGSTELKFKTGTKDSNNKAISLKMGTSSSVLDPLFSTSAGTVIVRNQVKVDADASTYQIWKGGYAVMGYTHEMFGRSGFSVLSYRGDYGNYMYHTYDIEETYNPSTGNYEYLGDPYHRIWNGPIDDVEIQSWYSEVGGVYVDSKPQRDETYYYNIRYVYDMPDEYLTDEYISAFTTFDTNAARSPFFIGGEKPAPVSLNYYILTDCEEEETPVDNNTYTLVKTFGDFQNTFVEQGGSSASMLLVYTDADGKEWALNPKGLVQVQSKDGNSGYDKIVAGADNELIPDNNSGTSATFGFANVDVAGTGEQVFTNEYALRKSRQNTYEGGQYLTMAGSNAWNSDDAVHGDGLVYVMSPTSPVYSQSDWDTPTSYKLRVIRNGETAWLGVADGKMVVVDSESAAVEFKVYAPKLSRYYSSAYGSDHYQYYKVYSVEDISEGDEILIAYKDDDGKRQLVAFTYAEKASNSNYSTYDLPYNYPAIEVLDQYEEVNTRDGAFPEGTRYKFRLDTDEVQKKPYAYFDSENSDVIWAQGVASNAIGAAKSETSKQRKYESVTPLGNQHYRLYIKADKYNFYHIDSAEVNFFPGSEEGLFKLRGGKSGVYLGLGSYGVQRLNIETGRYETNAEQILTFGSEVTDTPVEFEIYKKASTTESFKIEYYDEGNELEKTEIRPKDSLTLRQDADIEKDDVKYVFVGWTPDKTKAGLLGLQDSANLFDYDDLSNVASVTTAAKSKYGLLGDCNPDASNVVSYDTLEPFVDENDVLKLYPVYAVRGFSSYVTGDEGDIHVIGITDFKDLQMGGDGNPEARERWLGAINIEIYKDGALWVSETHGEPDMSGQSDMSGAADTTTATMYFAYHNDNAADLNVKFIEDVVDEELGAYLGNNDFSAFEPTEKYVIDAVFAEQGGSEDGLKFRYNWMDKEHGGQLDNVRGGSTVKVYVTTKYQVKYYFDANGDGVYNELPNVPAGMNTDAGYKNPNFYTTEGTERAVDKQEALSDYVVTADSEYKDLINETPSLNTTFKDDPISRGEYQYFLYKFDEYPHVIPIMQLPTAPEGYSLDSDSWTLYPPEGVAGVTLMRAQANDTVKIDPSSDLKVTETTYGTGNSIWSYKDATKLGDTTNTYHLYIAVQSIRFTKAWDDADNQDGIRPTPEEFAKLIHLWAGDKEVTEYKPTVVLEDGEYLITYPDAPLVDEEGQTITYTLTEDAFDGYARTDGNAAIGTGETMTNKHVPETVDIPVKKTWNDANDQDGLRPESITVHLFAGDEEVAEAEVVAGDDGEWAMSFTDMPKYKDGEEIVYSVVEEEVDKYTNAVDGNVAAGFVVTNKHMPLKIDIPVTKVWDDADNQDGVRPESVTVHLLANGEDTGKTVELDAEGEWKGAFEGLDAYADGKEIEYTVTEDNVLGYEVAVAGSVEEGFTLTNKHEPDLVDVAGVKTWDDADNQDGLRPESVTIKLLADGEEVAQTVVKAAEDGTWAYSFTGLPKNKGSKEIAYTVAEDVVEGYAAAITGYDVKNVHKPGFTVVNVKKAWSDAANQDGVRPESVTVRLLADGEDTGKTVVLSADNAWSASFEDLPEKNDGAEIAYTVAEDEVAGYIVEIAGNATDGYTLTNTHEPEKTKVDVSKTWDDANDVDSIRPTSVTVHLLANGEDTGKTVVLSADNAWSASFDGLDVNADGEKIAYTVAEDAVEDYATTISGDAEAGFEIVNKHEPDEPAGPELERINIDVTKTWDDADDQDGARPESITVRLLADGVDTDESLVLDAAGGWIGTFEGLLKLNDDGTEIAYTVTEDAVEGYTATVSGNAGDGFEITNKHVPETVEVSGSKVWDDADDQDGVRPESITVRLLADGVEVDSAIVTEADGWKWAFGGLPKYRDGAEIAYAVAEDPVEGYSASYDGYDIVNTREGEEPGMPTALLSFAKHYSGRLEDPRFSFEAVAVGADLEPLAGDGAWSATAQNGPFEGGAARAEIETPALPDGTHLFLVRESGSVEGVSNDEAAYLATVEVAGGAASAPSYELLYPSASGGWDDLGPAPEPAFYNNDGLSVSFRSAPAALSGAERMRAWAYPEVSKVLEGGALSGGEFAFELRDASGALVAAASNDAAGRVAFFDEGEEGLSFEEPGTYSYTVRERVPGSPDPYVSYDAREIALDVVVAESGGALSAELEWSEDPVFVNRAEAADVSVRKLDRETGEPLAGCAYALWMASPAGDAMVAEAVSGADGRIVFEGVSPAPGQRYYLREVAAPAGHALDPRPSASFGLGADGTLVLM